MRVGGFLAIWAFLCSGVFVGVDGFQWRDGDSSSLIRPATERQGELAEGKLDVDPHFIESLPGAPPVPFAMRSGYITVDEKAGRALFYWFVEADVADSASAPLTLWLNGGPGCSSVGGGMLSELGPFYPTPNGRHLLKNPYSWNKVSNMLFLESPAGVGFSYSNTTDDYRTGDQQTAQDSYIFLLRFFEQYPQYSSNKFYISGESYAGHYVPQLAVAILEGNKVVSNKKINFRGMAVGNAWTDAAADNFGAIFYQWTHALISDASFNGVVNKCNLSAMLVDDDAFHGVLKTVGTGSSVEPLGSNSVDECNKYVRDANNDMGDINIYDIYADICVSAHAQAEIRQLAKKLSQSPSSRPLLKTSYDPCVDDEVEVYLNRPEVQKALHANTTLLPWRWTDCSDVLNYSDDDVLLSILPLYHTLLESGIEILIFSGDIDAIVPVAGTRVWINTLPLNITEVWRPWTFENQVGGYVTVYDKLTFSTVRGAGHMVPYTQPARALHLFQSFINNKPL